MSTIELRGYPVKLYLHSMEFLGTSRGYFTRDACLSIKRWVHMVIQPNRLAHHFGGAAKT